MEGGLFSFILVFFSGCLEDSVGRPLGVVGVFGVFGAGGDLIVFGDGFGGAVVFVVDIGAGRPVNLLEGGLSTVFPVVTFVLLPFVCPFNATLPAAVFLSLVSPLSCLSTSIDGVSTATSGIVSSITVLLFLSSNSEAIDCFRSAVALGWSSASILKLVRRLAMLGSPLFSRFNPI